MRHRYYILLLARYAFASPMFTNLAAQIGIQTADNLKKTHTHPELWSPEFWEKIAVSAGLVLLGGVFAGYVVHCV
jgi:hypothetical protein